MFSELLTVFIRHGSDPAPCNVSAASKGGFSRLCYDAESVNQAMQRDEETPSLGLGSCGSEGAGSVYVVVGKLTHDALMHAASVRVPLCIVRCIICAVHNGTQPATGTN